MLPDDYQAYLDANLNLLERLRDSFSSTDERLDFLIMVQVRLLERLGGLVPPLEGEPGVPGEPGAPAAWPPGGGVVIQWRNRNSFMTGQRDVDVPGTAQQLMNSAIPIPDGLAVTIIAKPGNAGNIYLGSSKTAAEGAQRFDALEPGVAISLKINALNLVWVDADNADEGVSWLVERDD